MGESKEADSRDFKWSNYIGRYHMRHLDLMDFLAKYNARWFFVRRIPSRNSIRQSVSRERI